MLKHLVSISLLAGSLTMVANEVPAEVKVKEKEKVVYVDRHYHHHHWHPVAAGPTGSVQPYYRRPGYSYYRGRPYYGYYRPHYRRYYWR